jgi:hypothetical protein
VHLKRKADPTQGAIILSKRFLSQHAYLLRLWPVQIQGQVVWRANLTCIPDGEAQGFADLVRLFAHIENECGRLSRESHPNEFHNGGSEKEENKDHL